MNIGPFSAFSPFSAGYLGKAEVTPARRAFVPPARVPVTGQKDQAKPAASNTSLPTGSAVKLSTDMLMALQKVDPKTVKDAAEGKDSDAAQEFLDYMKKSPEERIRDRILKAAGLTEDQLDSLPPKERAAIEEKIKQAVKEVLVPADVKAISSRAPRENQPTFDQLVADAQ